MEEPGTQFRPVKRSWYGDGEQTVAETEEEEKEGGI